MIETETDVLGETLEDDESPDEGFDASTEETDSQQPDPVAEFRSDFAALKQSVADQVRSELGRIRTLESDIDRLKKTPAPTPQRDTFTEEAIEALAGVIVASPLVDDDAKVSVRSLLGRLSEAKTKNERESLRREITEEVRQAVAPVKEETDSTPSPEAQSASARVYDFAEGLGLTQDAVLAVLPPPWTLEAGETLENAITRLKGVLKAHVQTQTSNARVSERKQAAGSGSPQRTGASGSVEADLNRIQTDGIPITDEAARRRVAERLGVSL